MHSEAHSYLAACSERSLWLLITHCASSNLNKPTSLCFLFFFPFLLQLWGRDVLSGVNSLSNSVSDTPLMICHHSMKHTKELTDHIWTSKGLECVSSPLYTAFPRLVWKTCLSQPDAFLYCKKHIISMHAPFVYLRGECACTCVCFSHNPDMVKRRGGRVRHLQIEFCPNVTVMKCCS